jgi:hypothetical protein
MGDKIGANRGLLGRPKGMRPLGRIRRKCEDNIKFDPKKLGWGGIDSVDLAQDKKRRRTLMNAVMNLRVPYKAGNFSSS